MNAVVDALASGAAPEDQEAPSGVIAALTGFLEGGQDRRKWLNEKAEGVVQFIPPEMRSWLDIADMMNPVSEIGRAGQSAEKMMDPNLGGWERAAAGGDMLSSMAGVVAPVAVAKAAGMPAAQALQEALLSASAGQRDGLGYMLADESGALAMPSGSKAQQIAAMLSQGRAGDVTDDLMAQADPSELWKLYQSGATGADMPMDAASRMQRADAMGFDTGTPLYHGTGADIQAFEVGRGGGVSVSSPARANEYASASYLNDSGGNNVIPSYAIRDGMKPFDANGRHWRNINDGHNGGIIENPLFNGDRATGARGENGEALFMPAPSDVPKRQDINDFARAAKEDGYTGISVRNVGDGGTLESARIPDTTEMIFDPANIRSKFARFDPRLKHLANLSAAGAGVAYMGGQDDDLMDETRAWLEGLK